MIRMLTDARPEEPSVIGVEIRRVVDLREYGTTPYPAIGALTTVLRRNAFERLRALLSDRSHQHRAFVAWPKGKPVGAIEVFLGSEIAGIHGLSVLPNCQGRGIGSALVEHDCQDALSAHARTMVLLATSEGQRVYERRGSAEVGRMGYWYRSFQRDC